MYESFSLSLSGSFPLVSLPVGSLALWYWYALNKYVPKH